MNLRSGLFALLAAGVFPLLAQSGRQFLNLTDSRDFRGMQILDSVLQSNRLMVMGINRSYPEITRTVSTKLVSYAKNKAGYRYFMAPVSSVCGEWLHRLVYLNDVSVLPNLSLALNQQDILFYKRLNTLNEGVPDSLKIRIIGIDADNQLIVPALAIYDLLKDKTPPDKLRIPIEALQGAIRYQQIKNDTTDNDRESPPFSIKNTYLEFAAGFDTLKESYQNWLGDDEWFRMESLMQSLKAAIRYDALFNTALEDPFRVQLVSQNISRIFKTLPREKFICMMGRCFASNTWLQGECNLYNFSPVCSRLSEDSSISGQFFNLGVYYNEPADTEDETKVVQNELQKIRSGLPQSSVSLCHFNKPEKQLPFTFALVMGGGSDSKSVIPDMDEAKMTSGSKYTPLFSIGTTTGIHAVDVFELNSLMEAYGLPKVQIVPDYGINLSGWDLDNNHYEIGFFQRARIPGSVYHYWGTYFSGMTNLYSAKPWLKAGVGSALSYQNHIVNNPNTLSDTVFISRYTLPTAAVNPVMAMCLNVKGIITLQRFFLSAEAGYGWDISDRRWRVNNRFSGPMGKFRGNQIYVNLSMGWHLSRKKHVERKAEL